MKGDAYKHRATPWLFRDDHQPSTNYLAIPKVFSEDREYMTCDWYTPDIIAGDMVYTSPDRDGLAFAVIESRMFMTWQQTMEGDWNHAAVSATRWFGTTCPCPPSTMKPAPH